MEPTEEAAALRDFLRSQTDLESGKVEAVFVEICYGTRCANAGISEVMHRLDDLGVRFKQKQTGRDFTEIYQDFHNQTRMQCNRGHSPNELRAMQPAESNIPQTVSSAEHPECHCRWHHKRGGTVQANPDHGAAQ